MCDGKGQIERQPFTAGIADALRAARFAEHGAFPVAGGWHDQTPQCLDAIECVWSENDSQKAAFMRASRNG